MNTNKYTTGINKIPFDIPLLARVSSFHNMDINTVNEVMGTRRIGVTSRTAEYFSDLAGRHLAYGQQVLDVDVTPLLMRDITTLQAVQYLCLYCFESHISPPIVRQ